MSQTRIGVVIHTDLRQDLFTDPAWQALQSLGDVVATDSPTAITVEQACELLQGCAIGVGSWGTPRPCQEIMDACPGLRLWEHVAGSVKAMFGPHLEGRDLTIASCAPAIAENVAETAVGEIITGLRRIIPNAKANQQGRTGKPDGLKALSEATIGVVAASDVGRRVIRMLKPFRPRILVYDPFLSQAAAQDLGVELRADLTALCAECDCVTLHAPALSTTEKMIGADQLQAMPDHAVFVNTARGLCVDEEALIAELEKGRLFAFIDVTEPEPAADNSPLRHLPNAVLTSHIAGCGYYKIGDQAVADIQTFLAGGSPARPVTADQLERIA